MGMQTHFEFISVFEPFPQLRNKPPGPLSLEPRSQGFRSFPLDPGSAWLGPQGLPWVVRLRSATDCGVDLLWSCFCPSLAPFSFPSGIQSHLKERMRAYVSVHMRMRSNTQMHVETKSQPRALFLVRCPLCFRRQSAAGREVTG